jgi:hypothetical protein
VLGDAYRAVESGVLSDPHDTVEGNVLGDTGRAAECAFGGSTLGDASSWLVAANRLEG